MMKKIRKILLFIIDFIEIYAPTVCIGITFISFLVQIFSRYVLKNQVEWSYELTLIGFLWCLMLAACNASRTHTHVAFTLFYDKLNDNGKLVFRMVANVFILVTFGMLAGPAWEFIDFMSIKKTSVTNLPMDILFFPFIVFVVLTWAHTAHDFIKDIMVMVNLIKSRNNNGGQV